MRQAEIVTAVVLLAIAGAVLLEGVRLGPGWGEAGPRGGFFPFWLGVILAAASLGILAAAVRRAGPTPPFFPPGAVRLVLTVFLPMVVAFGLMELVGFYLAAFLYLGGYMRLTGRLSWSLTGAVSVLFPAATFMVFERWFLIPLPKGLFGERLLPF